MKLPRQTIALLNPVVGLIAQAALLPLALSSVGCRVWHNIGIISYLSINFGSLRWLKCCED